MPAFLKTPRDEQLWKEAKAQAEKEGKAGNYAYITGIWKRMKGRAATANRMLNAK